MATTSIKPLRVLTCPDYGYLLRQVALPVEVHSAPEIITLIETMRILMRKSSALGLAAPQVGHMLRIFVTAWDEVFINPTLELGTAKEVGLEGCLSLPGKAYRVRRSVTVKVGGKSYSGMAARVIQHEFDHLNGVLISDLGELVLT